MYNALIIDLDGTLLDTTVPSLNAVNRVLDKNSYPLIDERRFREICNNGARSLMKDAAEESDPRKVDRLLKMFIEAYEEDYYAPPYPHVEEVLRTLKEHGIRTAVFSNKVITIVSKQVEAAGLGDLFDLVAGDDGSLPLKPKPEGLFIIAKRLGVDISDVLMIGDAQNDIDAAFNAGIDSCFFTAGIGQLEDPRKAPTYMIDDYDRLVEIVLK